MEFRILVADGDEQGEIASLYRWLSQDPDVVRAAEFSLGSASGQPGAMGVDLDLINIVVSNSISAVSMVLAAVALWRQNRSPAPEVQVEAVKASVTVTVQSTDPERLLQIAAELTEVRRQGTADAAGSS